MKRLVMFLTMCAAIIMFSDNAQAEDSADYNEFDKKTSICDLRTGTSFSATIIFQERGDVSFLATFVHIGDDWAILDVGEGDDIHFIFDDNVDSVLSLSVIGSGNDVVGSGGGGVIEIRIIMLTEKLFKLFMNSTSIRCKIGSSYKYTFTKEDFQAFNNVWKSYQDIINK